MCANARYFTGSAAKGTFLRARGFDDSTGAKSGGIVNPTLVDVPAGAVVVRFYHDPKRRAGEWWSTARELQVIVSYFAREGPAFAGGRMEGKGILHATLAVRHDWSKDDPGHLGRFWFARTAAPLRAYYGEGDHAPDSTQTQIQKVMQIIDETQKQRPARQLFFPEARTYGSAFVELTDGASDTELSSALKRFPGSRLPFE
jgi:hypothetical protein